MKCDLTTNKLNIIDSGAFDDFPKYAYVDINFGEADTLFPVNIAISNNNIESNNC